MKSNLVIASLLALTACSTKQSSGDGAKQSEPLRDASSSSTNDSAPSATVAASAPNQPTKEGTIVSAGGYLYGYETNPWFLANTKVVKYCVDIDEENFGLSRDQASELIKTTIDQWTIALSDVSFRKFKYMTPDEIRIGGQKFEKASCDAPDVDLRFQLGTLSQPQKDRVTDPTAFVAEAFVESYDTVHMRAKGFIYVSPISGPLRPKNINRQSSLSNIWSDKNGMRFATVIAHELGHVFGFCHQNDWLMRENRPQLVVEHGLPSPFGGNLAFDRDILLKKIQATVGSAHLGTAAVLSTDLYASTENKELFLLKNEDGLANFVDQNSAIAAVRSRIGTFVMYRKQTDGSLIKVGELIISDFSFGQPTSTQPLKFPTEQTVFKGYLQDTRLNVEVDALNAFDLPIAWVSGVLRSTENLPDVSMRVDLYTNEDLRVFVVKNNQLVRISE